MLFRSVSQPDATAILGKLHWVLDMAFAEDRSRVRLGHGQENLALLRRWALSVQLQNTTVKGSMEKKRLQTGWNDQNLEKLLDLF